MKDIRQSLLWEGYLERLGWKTVLINSTRVYIRKIPFGSIIKIPRVDLVIPFEKIDEVAKKEKAFFVKIEPNVKIDDEKLFSTLASYGCQEESWSLQPTKTITIDLTQNEGELISNIEKDPRYSIRRSEREGVVVTESDEFEKFLKLHQETAKRQRFWVSYEDSKTLWESLPKENKTLLFARKDKEILAGAFLLFYEDTAYYYQAGSSKSRRDLLAPYLLVWESLRLSKARGCKIFDFEGIVDPRIKATRRWHGFTHFKRGFGGEEVTYLGSFIKFYNPVIKLIFSLNKFL